ncbi:DUF5063 domain-containing protein [Puteibacter caeruleilacunae]|nr:DUF5063 domain-containing protein [Puteibacter caeruleilacunae]
MSNEGFDHIVYSKDVLEFVTIANEYCNFIEQIDSYTRKDFIFKLQKFFPLLYLKASLVPKIDDLLEDATEKFVTEEDYNFLHNKLLTKLGEHDAYQEIFEEYAVDTEDSISASISENIVDIYQDLKDFILAYRIGTLEVMNDALYECQQNFEQYWGQRLVNALRAVHRLVFGNVNLDEEELKTPKIKSEDDEPVSKDWILSQQFKSFRGESE